MEHRFELKESSAWISDALDFLDVDKPKKSKMQKHAQTGKFKKSEIQSYKHQKKVRKK